MYNFRPTKKHSKHCSACTVDDIVYREGDSIPTGDPCEVCRCRPPGFHCVVRDCPVKPGKLELLLVF